MIAIDYQYCTGCRACEQICPNRSISILPDIYGFLYPVPEKNTCTNCRICEGVCPIDKPIANNEPTVYAAYIKDYELLKRSSSGGIFAELAKSVFAKNGVVYGCAWDENLKAIHIRITDISDLWRLQGSKYVQSDTGNTYQMVLNDLCSGLYVLYSGTPCQIHGLKRFLGEDYDSLLTVDIICHGTPSPLMFRDYITWLSLKWNSKIVNCNFRDKNYGGWSHSPSYTLISRNKLRNKHISVQDDPYYSLFLKGLISRESCYYCKYATIRRVGDFTLGDFWGVENFHPQIPTEHGVSIILINNNKASIFIEHGEIVKEKSTISNAMRYNDQLISPIRQKSQRDSILETWRLSGFDAINRLFCNEKKKRSFIRKYIVDSLLTQKTKTIIKKHLKIIICRLKQMRGSK